MLTVQRPVLVGRKLVVERDGTEWRWRVHDGRTSKLNIEMSETATAARAQHTSTHLTTLNIKR